jgi:hypothetical protein
MEAQDDDRRRSEAGTRPFRVRLPGFLVDEEVGLGDAIKRATTALRIPPCDDCRRRAAVLNRWMVFSPRSGRS